MQVDTDKVEELDIPSSIQMHLNLSMDNIHDVTPKISSDQNSASKMKHVRTLSNSTTDPNMHRHGRTYSQSSYTNTIPRPEFDRTPSFLVPAEKPNYSKTSTSSSSSELQDAPILKSNNNSKHSLYSLEQQNIRPESSSKHNTSRTSSDGASRRDSSSSRKSKPVVKNGLLHNNNNNVKETNRISLKYDPVSKKKVLNTYEILGEIGHGQHGKVKLAKHILTNELVAIKIVDRDEKKSRKFFSFKKSPATNKFEKINREIAIMKKCHHKHVVGLIEVLDDIKSNKIYLVLEYCAKGEVKWCPPDILETEAKGPPQLSFQRAREILRGVVLGLEYLHYQGIIHRDIKPANLLLSADWTVKISDFGVSLAATKDTKNEGKDALDELELAKTVGTPAFFAPEICLGDEAKLKYQMCKGENFNGTCISYMIDIWALGVTLYCLLFGTLPFISNFEMELFEKIVNEPLVFPDFNDLRKNNISKISCIEEYEAAKDLLSKLLTKNPMKRICIQDIKHQPYITWDFDHINGLSDKLQYEKQRKKADFQKSQSDGLQQISISNREVRHAVGGVGQKIKESVLKTLPLKYITSLNSDQSMNSDETRIFESINTTNESLNNNNIPKRDYSLLLSEGSTSDMSDNNLYKHDSHIQLDSSGILHEGNSNFNFLPVHQIVREGEISEFHHPSKLDKKQSFDQIDDTRCNDKDIPDMSVDNNNNQTYNNDNEYDDDEYQFNDPNNDNNDFNEPSTVVNLPINSSFASLDSFYIDNFAMSKLNNEMGNSQNTFDFIGNSSTKPRTEKPTREKSFVQSNRKKNSFSNLSYLNMGVFSTTKDRIPRNQPQNVPRPSQKRSSTDLTNNIANFRINSKTQLNQLNCNSTNQFSPMNKHAQLSPMTPINGSPRPDTLKNNGSQTESQKASFGSISSSGSSNFSSISAARISSTGEYKVKRGNFFASFNGEDEDSTSNSSDSGSNSSYDSSDKSDSEESFALTAGRRNYGIHRKRSPLQFRIESENNSVLSLCDLPDMKQLEPFLDKHSRPFLKGRASVDPQELVLTRSRTEQNSKELPSPQHFGNFRNRSQSEVVEKLNIGSTTSTLIPDPMHDSSIVTDISKDAIKAVNLTKNQSYEKNEFQQSPSTVSKLHPLKTTNSLGMITMESITSQPTTQESELYKDNKDTSAQFDIPELNSKSLLKTALTKCTDNAASILGMQKNQRSNSSCISDISRKSVAKMLYDDSNNQSTKEDTPMSPVDKRGRSSSLTVGALNNDR